MTANTWYDKGYNEGYEAAAKVAREQYALVDYWTDKVASLQAENARLRDALRPFANAAESMHSFTGQRYQLFGF